jgi:hypothetical protein
MYLFWIYFNTISHLSGITVLIQFLIYTLMLKIQQATFTLNLIQVHRLSGLYFSFYKKIMYLHLTE